MAAGLACLPVALVTWRRKGSRYGLPLIALGMVLGLSSCAGGSSNSAVPVVTLQSATPQAPAGNPVTLKAFVSLSQNVLGSITFSDAGMPLGPPVPLMIGRASLTTNPLGIGFHAISAAYSGDSATPAAASAPLLQVMTGTSSLQMQMTSGSISHTLAVPFTVQ